MSKLYFLCLACLLIGCKDDPNPIDPTPTDFDFADAKVYLTADAYGHLHHTILNFEIEVPGFSDSLGTAVYGKAAAYFFTNVSDTTYTTAGCAVNIGAYSLTQQTNSSYLYQQDPNDSLVYNNNLVWNVPCKGIDKAVMFSDFPSKANITSEKTISRLGGYTAKNSAFSGADSVIYLIQTTTNANGTKTIQKTMPGNSTQCPFDYTDLLQLDASNYAVLIITGYRVEEDIFSGKKYYSTFRHSTAKLVFVN